MYSRLLEPSSKRGETIVSTERPPSDHQKCKRSQGLEETYRPIPPPAGVVKGLLSKDFRPGTRYLTALRRVAHWRDLCPAVSS